MQIEAKEYIGDGAYAVYDGFNIWLYANDLYNPTDRVCLEPQVFNNLQQFAKKVYNKKEEKDG